MRLRSLTPVRNPLLDESGATAIEYALIAGLMALVCVASFSQLGGVVQAFYTITASLVAAAI